MGVCEFDQGRVWTWDHVQFWLRRSPHRNNTYWEPRAACWWGNTNSVGCRKTEKSKCFWSEPIREPVLSWRLGVAIKLCLACFRCFFKKVPKNSILSFIVGTIVGSFNSLDIPKEFQRENVENILNSSSDACCRFGFQSCWCRAFWLLWKRPLSTAT